MTVKSSSHSSADLQHWLIQFFRRGPSYSKSYWRLSINESCHTCSFSWESCSAWTSRRPQWTPGSAVRLTCWKQEASPPTLRTTPVIPTDGSSLVIPQRCTMKNCITIFQGFKTFQWFQTAVFIHAKRNKQFHPALMMWWGNTMCLYCHKVAAAALKCNSGTTVHYSGSMNQINIQSKYNSW